MSEVTKQSSILKYNKLAIGLCLPANEFSKEEIDRLVGSSDVWEIFAGVLLLCQSGDFAKLARVPELMRQYDDWLFWKAAAELIGYAGSWAFTEWFFKEFQGEIHDPGTQQFVALALTNACGLWSVEPLLMLHAAAVEKEPRYQIENNLSYLLEEDNDSIWVGAEEEDIVANSEDFEVHTMVDFVGYAEEVRAVRDEVVARVGAEDRPVYEGRLLDIAATARRLLERLTSEAGDESEGRIYRERMLFEASTGVDCSVFFDSNGALQRLPAAAVLEAFLESDAIHRFKPGQRYFFGHPIYD